MNSEQKEVVIIYSNKVRLCKTSKEKYCDRNPIYTGHHGHNLTLCVSNETSTEFETEYINLDSVEEVYIGGIRVYKRKFYKQKKFIYLSILFAAVALIAAI